MAQFWGFGDEALAAFIVFILGVVFTIVWQKYTEKNRRLAYRISVSQPKIDIGEEIGNRLTLLFDQQPIDNLYVFRVTLENVGNLAVQNQQVLIEFDENAVPLSSNRIEHEPLVGPVTQRNQVSKPYQVGYMIDLLPKGKKVEFVFFTKDNKTPQVILHWRNETNPETEVIEQPGQRLRAVDDHIQRILALLLIYFVVPPLVHFLYILVYTPFSTPENFAPSIYVREGVGALKGFILFLMYPSVKHLLSEWIRLRKQDMVHVLPSVTISELSMKKGSSLIVADSVSQRK